MSKRIKSIEFSDLEPDGDDYTMIATWRFSDGSDGRHVVSCAKEMMARGIDKLHRLCVWRVLDYIVKEVPDDAPQAG